ncbi:helix-turn-helix domain-containing protein [Acidomonas methanolica]|uniref:Transcriptional regulator XRE n=2 Tax=Acidomonas methanolica TaxID=437 RepID=A0A023D7S2_ACIMT|nr:helix-turn-helix domain-containing protein [Acidomonas methanolica]GAJ30178.1 transcriptional regulator XRE [Acidomonas methanolica NBRC 104435]
MDKSHLALAKHLKLLRVDSGLSLQTLSDKSGISRATLSRIENADVSPTAETLGRLASAFAIPLSRLLAPLEPNFPPLVRRAEQNVWTDPQKGFVRRSVSPPNQELKLEMIECSIEPHQRIFYDLPAFPGHEHHLVMLDGLLTIVVAGVARDLRPGDCLRYQLHGPSSFETRDLPARYVIAMA